MMFSSVASRRALMSKTSQRCFSSGLLVPLQAKADAPAEIMNNHISEYAHAQLQESYAVFNENCKAELQEMNKNIIENIIHRGGTEGWDSDMYAMKKTFEFTSFEEAQAFCLRVAKDAEEKDHHPEWSLSGFNVTVKLTSHFAENTVTRLDFEIAEAMNNAFTETKGSYKMYPMFQPSQWASIKIGLAMGALGVFFIKFMTGTGYEEKHIDPAPMPSTDFYNAAGKHSASQAITDVSVDKEVVDFAYGEYEKRDGKKFIPGV